MIQKAIASGILTVCLSGCSSVAEFNAGLEVFNEALATYNASNGAVAYRPPPVSTEPNFPSSPQLPTRPTANAENASSDSRAQGAFVPPQFGGGNSPTASAQSQSRSTSGNSTIPSYPAMGHCISVVRSGSTSSGFNSAFRNSCSEPVNVHYCVHSGGTMWQCDPSQGYFQGAGTVQSGGTHIIPISGTNLRFEWAACQQYKIPRWQNPGYVCR